MAASPAVEGTALSSVANSPPSDPPPSSSPVEMSDLTHRSAAEETVSQEDTTAGVEQSAPEESTSTPAPEPSSPAPPIRRTATRQQSEALGPAIDSPIALPAAASGPTLNITLMLTTGARHPYKIDEKYLKNRKVDAVATDGTFDPREISAYKLKELIWTDWRSEWEPRPASPSSIRLIILGRLMDDKTALKDLPFKLDDTNAVHMTVKPADFLDDDDGTGAKGTGKNSSRMRDGEERGAGCRCVIL